MSNPHPVKQQRHTGDAMPPRMKAKLGAFAPRDRVAGEALPRIVTVMHPRNIYRPAKHLNARSGLAICG